MIKKLKPVQAAALIETRRPVGLFYVYEDGVYTGIDNSTGRAWTEDFTSLAQCKEWLRNPSVSVLPKEWDEDRFVKIATAEELSGYALQYGIEMSSDEADILLGYLEGHEYSLMLDSDGKMVRHDDQAGADHSEDVGYSIRDVVMFCEEMNGMLLEENESRSESDMDYLPRLRKDEKILDALMEKTGSISCKYKEAA